MEEDDEEDKTNEQIEEYIARFGDDLSQEDYEDLLKIENKSERKKVTSTDYIKMAKALGEII